MPGNASLKYDFVLKHSPERVWKALTTSEAISKWLMPNDFQPKVGHKFTFRRPPMPQLNFDGISHCEVKVCEPPKKLAYTFVGGGLDTLITYRLEPEGAGTHLYFEHSGFDLSVPSNKFAYDGMGGGWSQLGAGIEKAIASLG